MGSRILIMCAILLGSSEAQADQEMMSAESVNDLVKRFLLQDSHSPAAKVSVFVGSDVMPRSGSFGFFPTESASRNSTLSVAWDEDREPSPGQGYDIRTGTLMPSVCVRAERNYSIDEFTAARQRSPQNRSETVIYQRLFSEAINDVKYSLNGKATVTIPPFSARNRVNTTVTNWSRYAALGDSLLVTVTVTATFSPFSSFMGPRVMDQDRQAYEIKPSEFTRKCGTGYISDLHLQSGFVGLVNYNELSEQERSTIVGSFGVGGGIKGLFDTDVQLSGARKREQNRREISSLLIYEQFGVSYPNRNTPSQPAGIPTSSSSGELAPQPSPAVRQLFDMRADYLGALDPKGFKVVAFTYTPYDSLLPEPAKAPTDAQRRQESEIAVLLDSIRTFALTATSVASEADVVRDGINKYASDLIQAPQTLPRPPFQIHFQPAPGSMVSGRYPENIVLQRYGHIVTAVRDSASELVKELMQIEAAIAKVCTPVARGCDNALMQAKKRLASQRPDLFPYKARALMPLPFISMDCGRVNESGVLVGDGCPSPFVLKSMLSTDASRALARSCRGRVPCEIGSDSGKSAVMGVVERAGELATTILFDRRGVEE